MIAGLMDGTVDCIATDHAPHALFEKEQEFERAPNGITGLETALGLALRVLHKGHGLSIGRVIELMSAQPAGIVSLEGRGTLKVGSFADVVVFDPAAEWSFEAKRSRSKSKNTPFDGAPMLGRVAFTVSEGRVVFRSYDSQFVACGIREVKTAAARKAEYGKCDFAAGFQNALFGVLQVG
jgi:dihydroorotase